MLNKNKIILWISLNPCALNLFLKINVSPFLSVLLCPQWKRYACSYLFPAEGPGSEHLFGMQAAKLCECECECLWVRLPCGMQQQFPGLLCGGQELDLSNFRTSWVSVILGNPSCHAPGMRLNVSAEMRGRRGMQTLLNAY